MKLTSLFGFNFAVNLLFGVAIMLAPMQVADAYGLSLNTGTALICRLFGALAVGLGAMLWRLKSAPSDVALRVTAPLALAHALGLVFLVLAVLDHAVSPLGWLSVPLYAFFALAYANLAFGERHVIGPAV